MSEVRFLPDVNVLIALSDPRHVNHGTASKWYEGIGDGLFMLCPITESGFVRLSAAPHVGGREMQDAIALLREMTHLPTYAYLRGPESWLEAVQPFTARLHGYRQVTDAYLLGLAIAHDAVLVTLDSHIRALAGERFQANLLTLG